MKIFFYFITCLLLCCQWNAYGQAQQKIDSLTQVLENLARSDDTVYVDVLNQIGFEYWTIDPSKSEQFGKEAAFKCIEKSF